MIKCKHFQLYDDLNFCLIRLYVYGGYALDVGIMNDLYKINLDDNIEQFSWENIEFTPTDTTPGNRYSFSDK